MTTPGLVIGTHTWELPADSQKIDDIVNVMRRHNIKVLDTARLYGNGASESAIGDKNLGAEFAVDTKAATGVIDGSGTKILEFADESFQALKVDKVRVYFLHAPDLTTPFSEQLAAIQKLYAAGRFERFGLSNFTLEQAVEVHSHCATHGYVLPSVYQASYSLAVRGKETALFPRLRELGFAIQAYSPMAAGFLAKTPEYIRAGRGSWDPATVSGQVYRDMYLTDGYMAMLTRFGDVSGRSGVSRAGLAYRWVRYHSALRGEAGDEMILGSVSGETLEEAVAELDKGPLQDWVAAELDALWDLVKEDAPIDNLKSVRKVVRPLVMGQS